MRIMLVGGGSGGHFYPLIAIAEELNAKYSELSELYYMGPEAYNQDLLNAHKIKFVYCPSGKKRRYRSILNFFDSFKLGFGLLVAIIKLFWIYPDVIMSKGSYTSVPVVLAAAFLRIPIVIHESDAVPGRANTLAAKFARYIAISYSDTAKFFPEDKVALTGIPIRRLIKTVVENPYAVLGISDQRPVLFVTGGSLGAERINTLILDSLEELLPSYTIVHQAGSTHSEAVKQTALAKGLAQDLMANYFVLGHLSAEQMAAAYSAATLIIARAGSTSIAEIAIAGKPSIIIPIPEEVSHDQRTNAYAYARTGAASVIEEKNLTDDLLDAEINRILSDQELTTRMQEAAKRFTSQDAAGKLAGTLANIALEH